MPTIICGNSEDEAVPTHWRVTFFLVALQPGPTQSFSMAKILIGNLIRQLQELQEGSRWFDQSFREKIGGLTAAEAFARPHPDLHSVAEQVSHIIEWRKEALRRFEGWRTELMHGPDDWKDNSLLQAEGWPQLLQALYASTGQLIHALEEEDDDYLETPFLNEGYPFHAIIEGIIQHDLYHLGQIGIVLSLLRKPPSASTS